MAWAQVVRSTMRHQQHESYDLSASVFDGRARVVVDAVDGDDQFVNGLDTKLEVVDPKDNKVKETVAMEQTAAGRYEASFPVTRYGTYILKASHRRNGRQVAESTGSVALPYPNEYLRSTPKPDLLRQAATITDGSENPKLTQVFVAAPGEQIKYNRDLWPYVVLFVACLFLLDVYLRRVRIFGYRVMRF